MSYIGTPPSNAFTSLLKQDFSTSATTGYTLDHAVNNANDIALFINFVRQEPTAGYAASGTSLVLTSATASSDDMYCVYLGQALQTVNPANASVGSTQLSPIAITGQTAEATIADGDTILIHDASASALRKMTKANFVSGIGGTNTPSFSATMSGGQTINNNTFTKINFDTEDFDVGSCFDTTNKRFVVPSGQAGKYAIFARSAIDGIDDTEHVDMALYLNGSIVANTYYADYSPNTNRNIFVQTSKVFDLDATDYIEAFLYHNEGDGRSAENTRSLFYGYKLIG